jgi:Rrf2 family protein
MISQKAKYALKALVALARAPQGAAVQIRDIALGENIPRKFLEQIMLDMKRAGYVASRRGRAGGYELLKPASAITYGEILRLIDGPIAPLPCLSRIAYRRCEDCGAEAECEIRRVFAGVAQATRQVLDKTTIEDSLHDGAPNLSLESAD